MTTRTGFCACDNLCDTEGDIGRLLETLEKALVLADLADVDLVAIHIANAIDAGERHLFMRAIPELKSDIAGALTALTANRTH